MKKKTVVVFVVLLASMMPVICMAETNFILDIQPGAMLSSFDAEDFKTSRVSGGYYWTSETEEIDGNASWMPSIRAGAGFDMPKLYLDVSAGLGYLWNDAFYAAMYIADVAFRFKLGDRFTVGPHLSVVNFDPTWDGTSEVELSGDTAIIPGVCFTVGNKRVSFSASFDYVNASFDTEAKGGWRANEDALDITGVSLHAGVLLRF